MEHMLGPNWIELFEFVGVSASKPLFYTGKRPFRLVSVMYYFGDGFFVIPSIVSGCGNSCHDLVSLLFYTSGCRDETRHVCL